MNITLPAHLILLHQSLLFFRNIFIIYFICCIKILWRDLFHLRAKLILPNSLNSAENILDFRLQTLHGKNLVEFLTFLHRKGSVSAQEANVKYASFHATVRLKLSLKLSFALAFSKFPPNTALPRKDTIGNNPHRTKFCTAPTVPSLWRKWNFVFYLQLPNTKWQLSAGNDRRYQCMTHAKSGSGMSYFLQRGSEGPTALHRVYPKYLLLPTAYDMVESYYF